MSRIMLVGGPEDGEFMDVADHLDFVRVPQKMKPATDVGGGNLNNETFKAFTYVRRGDVMVFDS